MRQLLNETSRPEVHGGSRDALVQYRRLVVSVSKFVDVHRRLTAIDRRLRQPDQRYSVLVDDLHGLESLLSSLDDESSLERQAVPVLQVHTAFTNDRIWGGGLAPAALGGGKIYSPNILCGKICLYLNTF